MAKMSNIMLALGVAMSAMAGGASQELPFRPGERVALFGDSITHIARPRNRIWVPHIVGRCFTV